MIFFLFDKSLCWRVCGNSDIRTRFRLSIDLFKYPRIMASVKSSSGED